MTKEEDTPKRKPVTPKPAGDAKGVMFSAKAGYAKRKRDKK